MDMETMAAGAKSPLDTGPAESAPNPLYQKKVQAGIGSFIRERNGKLSSSRLLILLWGGGVFVIWAISSLRGEVLQSIPESVITVVGIMVSAKTVQRFGE